MVFFSFLVNKYYSIFEFWKVKIRELIKNETTCYYPAMPKGNFNPLKTSNHALALTLSSQGVLVEFLHENFLNSPTTPRDATRCKSVL